MDILTPALILCVILSACLAAYFAAESRSRKAIILDKNELIAVLQEECRHWQNKALFVNRLSPLGTETKPSTPKGPNEPNYAPRVATLGMRRAKFHGQQAESITIHANEVKAPNIQETVEKARVIREQAEAADT